MLAGDQGQTLTVGCNLILDGTSQVNVALGAPSSTALFDVGGNGAVDGGSGVWRADGLNWTQADGLVNGPYQPNNPIFAIFQCTAGTVTAIAGAGAISLTGIQFATDSYRVEGDAIELAGAGGESIIRVGDGTAASACMIATITSELTANCSLVKSDYGTLVLCVHASRRRFLASRGLSGLGCRMLSTDHDRVALALLRAGADPHAKDENGSVQAQAVKGHMPSTAAWLDAHGIP